MLCVTTVLLSPTGLRCGPEAPEHSLYRSLLCRVHPQDHGLWLPGEIMTERLTSNPLQWAPVEVKCCVCVCI